MDVGIKDAFMAGFGAMVAGVVSLVLWFLNYGKTQAEIQRTNAERDKFEAEADDLTSTRLLRELNRLSGINDELAGIVERQRVELESMRQEIGAYALRESAHAAENVSLRARIAELEHPVNQVGASLTLAFPLDIPHQPNEFDQNDGSADQDREA